MLNVIFSPNGQSLVTLSESKEHQARLWNAATGQLIATLDGHKERIRNIYFGRNGELLVSESKDGVILWSGTSGELFTKVPGASWPTALSPDGHLLATGGQKGTVLLWGISPQ